MNPKLSTVYNPFPYPPLGLMILAANIRDKHKVKIIDRNVDYDLNGEDFKKTIKVFKPDIVGITSLTGRGILDGLHVSRIAKEKNIKVIWGGTHASMFPLQTLESNLIDYIVIGEGEIAFNELLIALEKGRRLTDIKGLGYKIKNNIKINPEREFIRDLDRYPMPAWDLVGVEKYVYSFSHAKRKIEMTTSRGCPFRCAFCYNLKFNKRQWRGRSAGKIIEEIKYLKKRYQIDAVRFADDLFTVNKKRVEEFCRMNQKVGVYWDANCRVNDVNENFLKMISRGKCHRITFGVESGSQRMMDFLTKDLKVKQCVQAFETLSKTKMMSAAAFMIGLPTETKKEARETINLAKRIKASHVHVYPYVPYPGSVLSEYCVKNGLVKYPERIEDWGDYSYAQQKAGIFTEKEINRIGLYFQIRNFINSLKRGEWGILKNFLNRKGFSLLKEISFTWLGLNRNGKITQ